MQFLAFIGALPSLLLYPFDAAELAKVNPLLKKFHDQNLTLADAHGLAIMDERHTATCWSTDRHLGLSGIPLAI